MRKHLWLVATAVVMVACAFQPAPETQAVQRTAPFTGERVEKTEAEWRSELTPTQFRVLREEGTERAFTGAFWDHKEKGTYTCAACELPLFDSATKFKSGTGWPSFYQPIDASHVGENVDLTHGMQRIEVHCNRCDGHLGHVFRDGPDPTGLRYCINSVSLDFEKK